MKRTGVAFLVGLLLTATGLSAVCRADQSEQQHRLVIQVSDGNPETMNLALNNAMNVVKALGQDNVDVEVVAYGPGLKLLLKSNARFRDRVASMEMYNVQFAACGNTMKSLKITKDALVEGVSVVDVGVLEIMKKQEEGWSYLRP